MKVVFISNFFNHHQKPVSDAMVRQGVEYSFIAYGTMSQERIRLGYQPMHEPYVIQHTAKNHEEVERLILDADVAIFGLIPTAAFEERLRQKKLTFLCSERLAKKGRWRLLVPGRRKRLMQKYHSQSTGSHLYLLACSAYAAGDYRLLGFPLAHVFKWGYFPRVSGKSWEELSAEKTEVPTILWVGRLLDWKRPQMALKTAAYLKKRQIPFRMKLIGTGPLQETIAQMIQKHGLSDCVSLAGAMPAEQVREEMEKAAVAIATSTRKEGWGAVVNEEMSSGCGVVASKAMGSVRFLIQDGKNGFSYPCYQANRLCRRVYELVTDRQACEKAGQAAYQTMTGLWNADVAVERFLKQSAYILANQTHYFEEEGPMSQGGNL